MKLTPNIYDEKLIRNEQLYCINSRDLNTLLHRSIGALHFLNSRKSVGKGSAFAISPNLIATAAHNIYDKQYRCENTEFKFYLGADGVAEEYYQVESIRYLQEFKTCHFNCKTEFDYALLKLKKSIGFKQYLPFALVCESCLIENNKEIQLQIFGFPGDWKDNYKPHDKFGRKFVLHQYGLARTNRIIQVQPQKFLISYAVSTLPGESGSPVCVNDRVIAIHTGGGKQVEEFNVGRLITPDLLDHLQKWRQEINGDSFTVIERKPCPHYKDTEIYIKVEQQEKEIKMLKESLHAEKKKNEDLQKQIKSYKQLLLDQEENNKQLAQYVAKLEKQSEQYGYRIKSSPILPLSANKRKISQNGHEEVGKYSNPNKDQSFSTNIHHRQAGNQGETSLSLSGKGLTYYDVTKFINLKDLNLNTNKLVGLDVQNNVQLIKLSLSQNQIKQIDLSKNVNLTNLMLSTNLLTTIDLSKNVNLVDVWLNNNQLTNIDLTKNVNLTKLYLSSNFLSTINLNKNIKLIVIGLFSNQLTTIDLNNNPALAQLYIEKNQLSTIDLSSNPKLKWVEVYENYLKSIIVWSTELEGLQLQNQYSLICDIIYLYQKGKADECKKKGEQFAQKYECRDGNKHSCKYSFKIAEHA